MIQNLYYFYQIRRFYHFEPRKWLICNLIHISHIFEEKRIFCFWTKFRKFSHSVWRRHSGGARHSRSERRASCRLGRVNHASTMQRRYSLVLMLLLLPPILYWLLQCYELLHTRAAVTLWACCVNNHHKNYKWVGCQISRPGCLFVWLLVNGTVVQSGELVVDWGG